jgi:hypothetical protein
VLPVEDEAGGCVARRTFTPEQVEAKIPALEAIFGQLSLVNEALSRTREELAAAQARGSSRPVAELKEETQRLQERSEAMRGQLDLARTLVSRVNEMGGQVKDLQRGLVDFPWRRNGRTVLLCWQFGEKRITHWHGADEGFSGRKAIWPDDAPAPPGRPEWRN